MPIEMVMAHTRMVARLHAEEALRAVTIAAVAAGTMDKDAAKETIRDWQSELPKPKPKPSQFRSFMQAAAQAGINVTQVPLDG